MVSPFYSPPHIPLLLFHIHGLFMSCYYKHICILLILLSQFVSCYLYVYVLKDAHLVLDSHWVCLPWGRLILTLSALLSCCRSLCLAQIL